MGLRFPRAGILAEEQAGWSSAVFEAAVEAVVSTYWILTLHWTLYQSAIAMKMLCNKHSKYPAQIAILPLVGLQVPWVWLLQVRPGSIMGWVSGHLGGSLGRSSSVSPPGTNGEHGMVFSRQRQGTQRCSRTHGVQAQAWRVVTSFSPSWPEKALWPPCGGPCMCGAERTRDRSQAGACPQTAWMTLPIPPCVGPLNRNYSHSCFSPRKLTSDRASKSVSIEGRMATRLICLQKWELQPHVLPGEPG